MGRKVACPECSARVDTSAFSPICECEYCWSEYRVKFELVGKRLKCPACSKITKIVPKSPRVAMECFACSYGISVPQRMLGWTIRCPKCAAENKVLESKEAAFLERAEERDYLVVRDIGDLVSGQPIVRQSEAPLSPHSRLAEIRKARKGNQRIRTESMMSSRDEVRNIVDQADAKKARRRKQIQAKQNEPLPITLDDEKKPKRDESEIFDLSVSIVKSNDPPVLPPQSIDVDEESELFDLSGQDAAEVRALFEQKQQAAKELLKTENELVDQSEILELPRASELETKPTPENNPLIEVKPLSELTHAADFERTSDLEPPTESKAGPATEPPSKPVESESTEPDVESSKDKPKSIPLEQTTVVDVDLVKSNMSLPDLSEFVQPSSESSDTGGSKVFKGVFGPAAKFDPKPPESTDEGTEETETSEQVEQPEPVQTVQNETTSSKFEKRTSSKLKDLLVMGIACALALAFAVSVGSFVYAYLANSKGDKSKRRDNNKPRIIRPGFSENIDGGEADLDNADQTPKQ